MKRSTHGDGHASTTSMAPCRCGCGAELVVACPKGCQDAELGLVADVDPIPLVRPPKGPDTPPRARLAPSKEKRVPAPRICPRCGKVIPRQKGRPPRYHEACLTEAEARLLKHKRDWKARHA